MSCGDSKTGDAGDDAEDDAGRVGDGDGQIARCFEQPVNHPQRAVNRGAKWLDGACLMSGEILLNLENIGCVHTDCGNGGDYGKDTDMFFVNGILQFVADFKNVSPERMDGFIKTIRF